MYDSTNDRLLAVKGSFVFSCFIRSTVLKNDRLNLDITVVVLMVVELSISVYVEQFARATPFQEYGPIHAIVMSEPASAVTSML